MEKKMLREKEKLIEFLMWLSCEKRFPLDVKDADRYIAAKGMCDMMCPRKE